jgi:hypothetical protein
MGGGFGAGSTAIGDVARGQGLFLMGLGQYNLSTAMAGSINTDTWIRWNQYVYLSLEEDIHKKYLSRMARQQHTIDSRQKMLERLRTQPDQADLRSGDALNLILVQLLDPRISPSTYRRAVVPLTGDTIRKIPFHYAPRAATFSMERLTGKREWPLSLRGEEFAANRKAYEKAVDSAIEEDIEGKLSVRSVGKIETALSEFQARVDEVISATRKDDLVSAKAHLRKLEQVPRYLRENWVERAIAEIETYPGTSVGDLLQFMQKHNLRFGVAETPGENALYASLFASLSDQSAQVSPAVAPEQKEADK